MDEYRWMHNDIKMIGKMWTNEEQTEGRARKHARTHAHARTHVRTYARTHAHTHARTYARTHARTHACTHACTHARTHACTHACTHARTHARTRARAKERTDMVCLVCLWASTNRTKGRPKISKDEQIDEKSLGTCSRILFMFPTVVKRTEHSRR